MKKFIFIAAAIVVSVVAFSKAEYLEVPKGPEQALQSPAYGGVLVDVSTLGLTSARNPFDGLGSVNSVTFSSGPCSGFVTLRDSDTANTSSVELARIYNVGSSSSGISGVGVCSGQQALPYPLRVKNGLSWDPSVGTFNVIGVGYQPHR